VTWVWPPIVTNWLALAMFLSSGAMARGGMAVKVKPAVGLLWESATGTAEMM
jgi:hypothetical protein